MFTPLEYGSIGLPEEDAITIFGEDNIEVIIINSFVDAKLLVCTHRSTMHISNHLNGQWLVERITPVMPSLCVIKMITYVNSLVFISLTTVSYL